MICFYRPAVKNTILTMERPSKNHSRTLKAIHFQQRRLLQIDYFLPNY